MSLLLAGFLVLAGWLMPLDVWAALQQLPGEVVEFPSARWVDTAASPSQDVCLMDAASEACATVMQAPKTGTIDRVLFNTRTVTTGATVTVTLETVNSSGQPTGTLLCAGATTTQVIADTDDNTTFLTDVGAGCAVTKGNFMALVVTGPAGVNLNINRGTDHSDGGPSRWAYSASFVAAAWTLYIRDVPFTTPGYDDGTFAYGFTDPGVATSVSINTGTTPDEVGIIFQVPVPTRLTGGWCLADPAASGTYTILLYDSDGSTVLATFDPSSVAYDAGDRSQRFFFSSTYNLAANTNYRLVLKPSTANSVQIWYRTFDAAAQLDAVPGGQEMHWTGQTNGGGFTQTTTQRPFMGVLLDAFDDGTGASNTIYDATLYDVTLQ